MGEPEDKCPVTLNQIAQATFKPFTRDDWEMFAGCEGREPQIAVVEDCVVVIDEAENITNIQVHESIGDHNHSWGWMIPTKPEQLI